MLAARPELDVSWGNIYNITVLGSLLLLFTTMDDIQAGQGEQGAK